MSLEATIWAWGQAKAIPSPSALLVLLCLADHADEDGVCWPSQNRIEEKTGLSERCIRDSLKMLEGIDPKPEKDKPPRPFAKLISRTKRNKGPDRTSDLFALHISPVTIFAGRDGSGPAPDAEGDRQSGSSGPAPGAGKSSTEPPKKNQRSPDGDSGAGAPPAPAGRAVSVPVPVQEAFDLYNEAALQHGWAVAERLNDDRRKKLRARLVEHKISGWGRALIMATESPFLMGRTSHGFRTTLDFLLQPSKLQKLIEGGYAGGGNGNGTGGNNGAGAGAGGGLGLRGNDIAAMHEAALEFGNEDY
jgi:hypothetical protein